MIISHKHKLIFIKTKKTAGTAVQLALAKECGPDDVLTEIEDTFTPPEALNGYEPRNNEGWASHHRWWHFKWQLGEQLCQQYFKFTLVRNPWERIVSLYWWEVKNGREKGEFLDWFIEKSGRSGLWNWDMFDPEWVDHVGKYETVEEDYRLVCEKLGIPIHPLPKGVKEYQDPERKHYREYYDNWARKIVEENSQFEIQNFGYEF